MKREGGEGNLNKKRRKQENRGGEKKKHKLECKGKERNMGVLSKQIKKKVNPVESY